MPSTKCVCLCLRQLVSPRGYQKKHKEEAIGLHDHWVLEPDVKLVLRGQALINGIPPSNWFDHMVRVVRGPHRRVQTGLIASRRPPKPTRMLLHCMDETCQFLPRVYVQHEFLRVTNANELHLLVFFLISTSSARKTWLHRPGLRPTP